MADAERRVGAALERTERLNQTLNVYLHLDLEGARAAAAEEDAIDEARGAIAHRAEDAAGEARSPVAPDAHRPLAGMPICVKDNIDVEGMPTTAGAADWVRHPETDALVVERLRDAGAIVVGKGNLNEFAAGIEGRNPHRGDCHEQAFVKRLPVFDPFECLQQDIIAYDQIGHQVEDKPRHPPDRHKMKRDHERCRYEYPSQHFFLLLAHIFSSFLLNN